MKKILSLFLMFAMSMTMWADKTLYLVPNSDWKTDQAKFAVYYYVDNTDKGWSDFMTLAEGETDVYTTTIPDGYPKVIFCRMNPAVQTRSWDSKWNQTGDLTLPTDGKNMFTITEGDNWTAGTWGTYGQAPEPTPVDDAKYYITGDSALVDSLAWNPKAIKAVSDTTVLNLAAGDYKLKVTVDGTWNTDKGYSNLTTKAEGLSADNDNNIVFTLAEAGAVTVVYNDSVFVLEGTFYVEPIVPIVVKDLHLVPGVWTTNNAVLGAWAWGAEAAGAWSVFAGEGDTLTAKINQKADSVIFVRFANGQTLDWNSTEWNRTANLKIDSCGLFFVNDWDNYSWCEAPEPAPVDDAKYYITGDSVLVGDSLKWNPKAIKAVSDSTTLNLAAGSYKLKVTVDGTWATDKGYSNLTTKAAGLSADNDNNIVFTLAEAGAVTVVYNDSVFVLVGTFYVEPIVPIVVKDLHLVPGVWTDDNAVLGAWAWGENADGAWSAFAGEGDTLTAKINQKADSVIFVRFANGQTLDWNSTEWNRTANLGIDSCGLFFVNDWDNYSWCEAPEPAPVDDAKYYITGDSALVDSLAWNPKAIKAVSDTTVLNLAAGDYKLKVTVDGTWNTAKGYSDLTTQEQGLSVGDNNNILFTLAAAGNVIVIYIAATAETDEIFRLIGNFATDQPTDLDLIPAGQTLYKVIENGTLYIYREGTKYNAAGQVVR